MTVSVYVGGLAILNDHCSNRLGDLGEVNCRVSDQWVLEANTSLIAYALQCNWRSFSERFGHE